MTQACHYRPSARRWCLVLAALVLALSALACDVPVFRYALERWPADRYEAYWLLPKGMPALPEQTVGNLRWHPIPAEVAAAREPWLAAWVEQYQGPYPCLVLPYPPHGPRGLSVPEMSADADAGALPEHDEAGVIVGEDGEAAAAPAAPASPPRVALRGPMPGTAETWLAKVSDSPARQELGRRLVAGDSAVWLLLDGSDAALNTETATRLADLLREAELRLTPPPPDAETLAASPALPAPDPYPIRFSILRLAANDPAEEVLRALLLASEDGLAALGQQPMAFPVFGRGRVLHALVGRGINAQHVQEACAFLTGPCSCEIKDLNPGWDLPMPVAWDTLVKATIEEAENPELPTVADLAPVAADPDGGAAGAVVVAAPAPPPAGLPHDHVVEMKSALFSLRWMALAGLVILVLVVGLGTWWLLRQRGSD